MQVANSRSSNKIILTAIAVFILAAFLRLYHIDYGLEDTYPIPVYDMDEWGLCNSIHNMLQNKSMVPTLYAHSHFSQHSILILALPLRNFILQGNFWVLPLIARSLVATFGIATIVITYMVAKRFYGLSPIALLSALFLTLSVYHIRESRFYMADVIQTFFLVLAVYYIHALTKAPKMANYLKCGVAIGFALGAKHSSLSILIVLALVHLLLKRNGTLKQRLLDKRLYGTMLLSLMIFFILTPYLFLHYREFLNEFLATMFVHRGVIVYEWHISHIVSRPLLDDITNLFWGMGPVLFLAATGIIYSVYRRTTEDKIILLYLLLFGLPITFAYVKFSRYYVPLIPFLSILAANITVCAYRHIRSPLLKCIWVALVLLIILLNAFYAIAFINIYSDKDPRSRANEWIIDNITEPSVIYIPYITNCLPQDFNPDKKHDVRYIKLRKLIDRNIKYRNLPKYSPLFNLLRRHGAFKQRNLFDQDVDEKAYFEKILSSADYIIETDYNLEKYTAVKSICPEQYQFYNKLFNEDLGFKLIKQFRGIPHLLGIEIEMRNTDTFCRHFDQGNVYIFRAERIDQQGDIAPIRNE